MKKNFKALLEKNFNNGYFTLIKDNDDHYCVFSTKDEYGNLRHSSFCRNEERALQHIGRDTGYKNRELKKLSTDKEWKFVRLISLNECVGPYSFI